MQKVQRWSQPFWTCTKARVWPSILSITCGRIAVTAMMSDTAILSLAVHIAGVEFFLIADDTIDFRHRGEGVRFCLRRAAGNDDACTRPFALDAADGLLRLAHRLRRHRTGIHDDRIVEAGRMPPRAGLLPTHRYSAGSRK